MRVPALPGQQPDARADRATAEATTNEALIPLVNTARSPVLQAEPTYLRIVKLIDSTPVLLAAQLRLTHDEDDGVVRALANREGVDPATDLRPRILAAAFGALVFLATREWRTGGAHDVGT